MNTAAKVGIMLLVGAVACFLAGAYVPADSSLGLWLVGGCIELGLVGVACLCLGAPTTPRYA